MVTIATVNSTNYNEATPVTFTLHVTKANQTITAPSSASVTYGTPLPDHRGLDQR